MSIGLLINAKYSEIDKEDIKRHNLVVGQLVSGLRYPIVTKEMAERILNDPFGAEYPRDCIWDFRTNCLVHLRYYFKMYPSEIVEQRRSKIKELDLMPLFEDEIRKIASNVEL